MPVFFVPFIQITLKNGEKEKRENTRFLLENLTFTPRSILPSSNCIGLHDRLVLIVIGRSDYFLQLKKMNFGEI